MKCVFLDIDGVMNSVSGNGPYVSDMEQGKLFLLKRLLRETGSAGIVLTSDRRCSATDLKSKKQAFAEYEIRLLGVLRDPYVEMDEDNRGEQIMDYLESSNEDIEKILILDDQDDGISPLFAEDFLLINRYFGLREEDVLKAVERLK